MKNWLSITHTHTHTHTHTQSFENLKILELGTGWHPIMPLLFYVTGANEIITIDLRSHIRKSSLKRLIEKLISMNDAGKLQSKFFSVNSNRINELRKTLQEFDGLSTHQILNRCKIKQVIIDANNTGFAANNFDVCYSVNVLEHVKIVSIRGMLKEMYRVGKLSSYHYHAIGVYDHFVHVDKSISKFNYLKYSERAWRWIDNDIQPQNRKRISYFRKIFKDLGFKIKFEILWQAEPEEIAKIKVHQDFINTPDIDIPYGTFILTK